MIPNVLSLFLSCAVAPAQHGADQLVPEETHAVIVGVLQWESDTLSSFSEKNRRDQGLYDELIGRGVPADNMALLLDEAATEANMLRATKEISRRAGEGATLLFYYAGHGYPGSQGIYFASHDAGANDQTPEGFLINDVTAILEANYEGARVLLLADCCYSGGLADVAQDLSEAGFEAASLTSASIANTSTGQWTFTCSFIDAVRGRRLLDLDGDGFITLSEAAHDVKEAMALIESQNHGYAPSGLAGSYRLSRVMASEPRPRSIPKPYALRQYLTLGAEDRRKTARIVDYKNGKLELEIQRYHDRRTIWRAQEGLSVKERPELPAAPASSRDFPRALSARAADKKATVDGKYSQLLKKITVKFDYLSNGEFKDYGYWDSETYAGHSGLPEGYWVYVYPDWYIFGERARRRLRPRQRGLIVPSKSRI